ncbi:hypothetical protein HYU20_01190 [Candidatus Woesearchaeota archaeon]|nr:hypothetical protein [Candidatus Woesearchaeota archaeon]
MADAAELMTYVLVFVTGFITGKLFAALQFAGMKFAAKRANADPQARKSVNRLIRLGRKI